MVEVKKTTETQATGLQVNNAFYTDSRLCWGWKNKGHVEGALTAQAWERLMTDPVGLNLSAQLWAIMHDPNVDEATREAAKNKYKGQLPWITPHAQAFADGHRVNEGAVYNGLVMLDLDHVHDPRSLWQLFVEKGGLEKYRVALAHITPSCHGLRIIFENRGGSIEENQAEMADFLGFVYDESVKDLARMSYLPVGEDWFLYLDKEVMFTRPAFECEAVETRYIASEKAAEKDETQMPESPQEDAEAVEVQTEYEGVPLKDIAVRYLVNKYGRLPVQGQRNTQLLELARELTSITDGEAAAIRAALPDVGLSDTEMDQIVANAVKYKREHMNAHIGKDLNKAIADIRKAVMTPDEGTGVQGVQGYTPACAWEMPKDIPPGIKENTDRCLDPTLRPAAYVSQLPAWGTVFPTLRAKMDEDAVSEGFIQYPQFHVCVSGKAGAGKSWAIKHAKPILKLVSEREATETLREQEYREKKEAAKNKKEQPKDPKVRRQLMYGADATRAGYIKLQQRSQGLALYTSTSEISEAIGVTKRGLWGDLSLVWRKGYCDELCGQERAGEDFVSAEVNVRINCLFAGQPDLIKEFYGSKESIHNGLIQRLILADIGDRRYMAPPSFRKLTAKQQDTIDAAIQRGYNLSFDDEGNVRGEHWLKLDWLSKAVIEWREAKREECSRLGIPDEWLNRSADNGFRAGMIAFELWEESSRRRNDVIDNALWVAEYAFSQLIANFGDKLVATNRQQTANTPLPSDAKRIVANLPDEFGVEEFVEQMKFFGIDLKYRKRKTMNAVKEQLIVKVSEKPQRWQKTILGKALAPTASLTSTTTRPPLLPAA